MQKSRHHERKLRPSHPHADDATEAKGAERRRSHADEASHGTAVRLTRKYAEMIDGVDLTRANVGDELMLNRRDADVLMAEGWAEPAPRNRRRTDEIRSVASEKPHAPKGGRR